MSAIGNFEVVAPSREMLQSYAQLLGWKLSRYGVDGNSYTTIDNVTLSTISGHRDAAATACPGGYLYAKIPAIRARVAAAQGA
jgi:predicted enzyme related to lactoylglutathione lyase